MVNEIPPILEIGGILISSEIITECFCCDYEKCKGICCVEGSDGAPVTLDEIAGIEDALDTVWPMLSASAQSVIDKQGVADGDNCLCALEKAAREKAAANNSQFSILNSQFVKPISCALYPIREKNFGNGLIGLNYHRWTVCKDAVEKGKALGLPVYQFLKEPLIRRFGEAWYQELCEVAEQLTANSK